MKAFLIDPKNQSITEVDYDNSDYKNIYKLIDCGTFTTVDINKEGDCIYVDDEGLLYIDIKHMFTLDGNRNTSYAGKGLVLGTDSDGESCEPIITLDELKERVTEFWEFA
tara:strand:+ start:426 stop:755 length:330 start_codon:yes stop_codon:yes gene_type:complete